jgi:hypothetical protein
LTPVSRSQVASSLAHIVAPTDATRARRNDLSGFDFRIGGTRCSCTAPCKEQAGNSKPSSALFFYTRRLVLGSDQACIFVCASSRQNAPPLPALMLRSIAARRVCKGFNSLAALRCVSKHEGAPDHSSSSFETRYARSSLRNGFRMRAPQDEDEHRVPPRLTMSNSQSSSFPRRVFAPGVFASLLRQPESRVGGAPRDVRVQRHPWGLPPCVKDARERAYDAAGQAPSEAPCVP